MARTLRLVVLVALITLFSLVVVKLRATRSERASLDSVGTLAGSFDTWPEVPLKQSA